jgi:iron complex outermembrane receptor protein
VIDNVPVAAGGINGEEIHWLQSIKKYRIYHRFEDASATAIYGSRASNGVIIITTKRKEENWKYNGNLQVSEITNKVDALSSTQFRDFVTANGTAAQIALLRYCWYNWQDEIYRTAKLIIILL